MPRQTIANTKNSSRKTFLVREREIHSVNVYYDKKIEKREFHSVNVYYDKK